MWSSGGLQIDDVLRGRTASTTGKRAEAISFSLRDQPLCPGTAEMHDQLRQRTARDADEACVVAREVPREAFGDVRTRRLGCLLCQPDFAKVPEITARRRGYIAEFSVNLSGTARRIWNVRADRNPEREPTHGTPDGNPEPAP